MSVGPYRRPAPPVPDPYLAAWTRLRRRRLARRAWFAGLAALLLGAVVAAIAGSSGSRPTERLSTNWTMEALGGVLGFSFIGVVLVGARHFLPFVCPRCGQPFFEGPAGEMGLARECVECGLTVGTRELEGKGSGGTG